MRSVSPAVLENVFFYFIFIPNTYNHTILISSFNFDWDAS